MPHTSPQRWSWRGRRAEGGYFCLINTFIGQPCGYTEPFKADKRRVVGLAVELDSEGKGLIDWKVVE